MKCRCECCGGVFEVAKKAIGKWAAGTVASLVGLSTRRTEDKVAILLLGLGIGEVIDRMLPAGTCGNCGGELVPAS